MHRYQILRDSLSPDPHISATPQYHPRIWTRSRDTKQIYSHRTDSQTRANSQTQNPTSIKIRDPGQSQTSHRGLTQKHKKRISLSPQGDPHRRWRAQPNQDTGVLGPWEWFQTPRTTGRDPRIWNHRSKSRDPEPLQRTSNRRTNRKASHSTSTKFWQNFAESTINITRSSGGQSQFQAHGSGTDPQTQLSLASVK
jgi:hypothetical protein